MRVTNIRIPLFSYRGDVPESKDKYEISSTGHTIKITSGEKVFYGLYPNLPRVEYEDFALLNYSGINWNLFGDAADKLFQLSGMANIKFRLMSEDNGAYYAICEISYSGNPSTLNSTLAQYEDEYKDFVRRKTGANIDCCVRQENQTANQENQSNKTKKKEGQNKMANLFGDIKVGKAGSKYSLTYFGTIAYEGKTYLKDKIFDATGMTINFDMLYLVPSAEVKAGDIIDKNGKAYYVKGVSNGVVNAIDLVAGTEENLVPGGPFGMTMYSKIFNPMGNMAGDNSFGNMLMMQALMGDDNYGGGNNGMLLAMMMMQGGFKFPTFEMPTVPTVPTVSGEKPAENK